MNKYVISVKFIAGPVRQVSLNLMINKDSFFFSVISISVFIDLQHFPIKITKYTVPVRPNFPDLLCDDKLNCPRDRLSASMGGI